MTSRTTLLLLAATLMACGAPEVPTRRILTNDNLVAAGRSRGSVRTLALEIREGDWYPESDTGLSEPILAFGEAGKPLQVPGPLLRVPVGTLVRATIANRSTDALVLHGFGPRGRIPPDSLVLSPGSERKVEFSVDTPGTWFYWAAPPGATIESRHGIHSQLDGAFIVDSTDAMPHDRVFVLGEWNEPIDSTGPKPWVPRDLMTINGRMWPYTERFSYVEGDSVHWRWINPSSVNHPMHLHGFYYDVLSRGDARADTSYAPEAVRTVVTETLTPGTTMTMAWQAARAGNWLFHCHFAFHVSHFLSLHKIPDPEDVGGPDAMSHSPHMMAGLVLGLEVKPRPGAVAAAADSVAPRQIRITARELTLGPAQEEEYHYFVQGEGITPGDSANPTLVLQRGMPAQITIVNRLRAPTAIHWHGIELTDSYVDGVPDWSGTAGHVAPAIAPGDSFTVRFTPPRAGTFMYHSHWNEIHQIAHGLYAALLVTDATAQDTLHERLFVIGGDDNVGRVNRHAKPRVTRISAGRPYRFRLVNIHGGSRVLLTLTGVDSTPLEWRPLAKDGADLPAAQSTLRPALVALGPGEIVDVEVKAPRAGLLRLNANSPREGWKTVAPIEVR